MVLQCYCHDIAMVLPHYYYGMVMRLPWQSIVFHSNPMVLPWELTWKYIGDIRVIPFPCHGNTIDIGTNLAGSWVIW